LRFVPTMHRNDHIIRLAHATNHTSGQTGFHVQFYAGIGIVECLQNRRHQDGPIVVHNAESHLSDNLMLPQSLNGLLAEG